MIDEDEILEFLESLGDTPQEIAKHVPRGTRDSACDCPLAKALKRKFPYFSWGVSRTTCNYSYNEYPGYGPEVLYLPSACEEFVDRFDKGEFWELDDGSRL
jgi:hypothetical protein